MSVRIGRRRCFEAHGASSMLIAPDPTASHISIDGMVHHDDARTEDQGVSKSGPGWRGDRFDKLYRPHISMSAWLRAPAFRMRTDSWGWIYCDVFRCRGKNRERV